jgi:hypothetical protein
MFQTSDFETLLLVSVNKPVSLQITKTKLTKNNSNLGFENVFCCKCVIFLSTNNNNLSFTTLLNESL